MEMKICQTILKQKLIKLNFMRVDWAVSFTWDFFFGNYDSAKIKIQFLCRFHRMSWLIMIGLIVVF